MEIQKVLLTVPCFRLLVTLGDCFLPLTEAFHARIFALSNHVVSRMVSVCLKEAGSDPESLFYTRYSSTA